MVLEYVEQHLYACVPAHAHLASCSVRQAGVWSGGRAHLPAGFGLNPATNQPTVPANLIWRRGSNVNSDRPASRGNQKYMCSSLSVNLMRTAAAPLDPVSTSWAWPGGHKRERSVKNAGTIAHALECSANAAEPTCCPNLPAGARLLLALAACRLESWPVGRMR
jgi:hypothetical protein